MEPDVEKATVAAYRLPDGSRLEEALQRDGSVLWVIRNQSQGCMAKDGQWEWEPRPSGRNDAFMARCRFATVQEAYETWERAVAGVPMSPGL